jgi:prepilin peptidase CpaA
VVSFLNLPLTHSLWLVLAVALVISVVTDLMSRRILDLVTFPTVVVALGLRAWGDGLGDPEKGAISGLIGAVGAFALFAMLAWRGRGFGWGDVKLMAAVGACLGYPLVMAALVFISLVGFVQALITLIWQGAVWETLFAAGERVGRFLKVKPRPAGTTTARRTIPYGVAIALGSFWAMWWQWGSTGDAP